jgi:hypothetical protein
MTSLWIEIRFFFERLMHTSQTHKFQLDVTPGDEKHGIHLWCEAGGHDPTETSFESRYELQAEVATSGRIPDQYVSVATFDCAPGIATANRHRDHDRSLCNVAKHGNRLLA